jgi:hypothetical protein
MVRKLGELSNCVVFNSGQNPLETVSFSFFPYYCLLYTGFCTYFLNVINLGLVMFSWLCFSDEHE